MNLEDYNYLQDQKLKQVLYIQQQKLIYESLKNGVKPQHKIVDLKMTESAIHHVINTLGTPVCGLDFVGYMFPIHYRWKINGMLDILGNFGLYSADAKKPVISKFKEKQVIKHLLKIKFLHYIIEPFPEFNIAYNVPINLSKAKVVEGFIFTNYSQESVQDAQKKMDEFFSHYEGNDYIKD